VKALYGGRKESKGVGLWICVFFVVICHSIASVIVA